MLVISPHLERSNFLPYPPWSRRASKCNERGINDRAVMKNWEWPKLILPGDKHYFPIHLWLIFTSARSHIPVKPKATANEKISIEGKDRNIAYILNDSSFG